MKNSGYLSHARVALAGAALIGSVILGSHTIYRMDRNAVQRWNSYTNTLPKMIAEGRVSGAREIYEDTWREINQRIKDQGRDPFGFISEKDVARLERDFTWDVLVQRARSIPSLDDRDHTMYEPLRSYTK